MGATARYFPRAPRYVLRPNDQSLMRFAGMNPTGDKLNARLRDLSSTGLSFVVDDFDSPSAGEMLKIEFELPDGQRMAWFATVVRVERRSEWDPEFGEQTFTLVALRFRELPQPYCKMIQKGLKGLPSDDQGIDLGKVGARSGISFTAVTVLLFGSFFWLSVPANSWIALIRGLF